MNAQLPIDHVLAVIGDYVGRAPRRSGPRWSLYCPVHEGDVGNSRHSPSLSVAEGSDDKVLIKCHAGCTVPEILEVVGLVETDLFPPREDKGQRDPPVATYDYVDEGGELLYQVVRYEPKSFRQRQPDGAGGWKWSLEGVRRVLYRLPKAIESAHNSRAVFLVEGEKDVETAERLGLVATTVCGGSGAWRPEYATVLKGAHVVILPDADAPGRAFASTAAEDIYRHARTVRIIELPNVDEKGDLTDWVAAGHTRAELVDLYQATPAWSPPETALRRQTEWTAAQLLDVQWPPPRWAIPGVVPVGLTLLAGASKVGKSWLALDWAVSVAAGGYILGRIRVQQGRVLYLALEDSPERLTRRLYKLSGGPFPGADRLHVYTAWDRLDQGGADRIEEFLRRHPDTRLVVVDVFAKVRGPSARNGDRYQLDYEALTPLKVAADNAGTAILLLHHTRKAEAEDTLETVSGTMGLPGAADTVLVLGRPRSETNGELFITGRDVDEDVRRLDWDDDQARWKLAPVRSPDLRRWPAVAEVVRGVEEGGRPMEAFEVAKWAGRPLRAVLRDLDRAVQKGALWLDAGRYYPADLIPDLGATGRRVGCVTAVPADDRPPPPEADAAGGSVVPL